MKILFIGNSHTYMNDMPELASEMIEDVKGEACEVFMIANSGRSLKWHMAEEYFSERFNILHGKYDYCVIQEQAHPMGEESDTVKYATQIIELCKKAGTMPIIFETWAEKDKPENQAEMNRRYRGLAENQNALLAPIGEVWSLAKEELGSIDGADLYFKDGAHASPIGTYLTAMVLTKTITGKLPSKEFLRTYDFSIPCSGWMPVNEDTEKELVSVDPLISGIIRKCIER